MKGRFWVMGPVDIDGDRKTMRWGVVDGHDFPGRRTAIKPIGYQEFWPSEAEANEHAEQLNYRGKGIDYTARILFEIARPCFNYAKRGTPDGGHFEASEVGRQLMRAMVAIAAAQEMED